MTGIQNFQRVILDDLCDYVHVIRKITMGEKSDMLRFPRYSVDEAVEWAFSDIQRVIWAAYDIQFESFRWLRNYLKCELWAKQGIYSQVLPYDDAWNETFRNITDSFISYIYRIGFKG